MVASAHDKRTLITNAAWNWLGFAVSVAVTFVVCPRLVAGLGDERYGIWALVESVVAYFSLLDMGIGASVVRYVAKFEASEDQNQLDRVFSTTCALFIGAGLVALLGSAGMALLWQAPLGVPEELSSDARWLLLLLGANVACELAGGVFGSVLLGLGRFPARVASEIVLRIVGAIGMVSAVRAGYGVVAVGVVCLTLTLTKAGVHAVVVKHYLPRLRFAPSLVTMDTFRTIRGYSILAFVAMIAGRISFSTSAIVIGAFLAPEYITYYVVAARLTEYVKSGSRAITNVLTPTISALEAQGRHEAIRRVLFDVSRYVLLLVLPVEMGLLFLGKPFLTLWIGERLAELSYPTLVILSIPLFLTLLQSVSSRILYGVGKLKSFTIIVTAEAVVNLGLSVALVQWIGIEGVALALVIPNAVSNLAVMSRACHVLNVPFAAFVWRAFAKPICLAPIAPIVWLAVMHWTPIDSWLGFVFVGSIGTIGYAACAYYVEIRSRSERVRAFGQDMVEVTV